METVTLTRMHADGGSENTTVAKNNKKAIANWEQDDKETDKKGGEKAKPRTRSMKRTAKRK